MRLSLKSEAVIIDGKYVLPTVHRFNRLPNGNGLFWDSFNLGSMRIN